jgi:S1-C subfamily serine protease
MLPDPNRSGRPGEAVAALGDPGVSSVLMRLFVLALALLLTPAAADAQPCTESLTTLFDRVSPAVVSIQAMKINKIRPQRRFETIVGSGLIIDRAGEVLTNAHVVDGAASMSVTLDNGAKVSARVLGLDPVLDVALLRVETTGPLPIAQLGDSSTVKVGDEVVAIGNPLGLDQTMTRGIVSGLNRMLPGISDEPMIQTDAPINPGNSGGPLVDRCGRVIGINTLISEDAQSIGFAIPINAARAVLRDLREAGRVVRPWLGMQGRAIDAKLGDVVKMPIIPGYLVEIVFDGSPAEQAGVRGGTLAVVVQGEEYLLGGDIVTAIQGTPVRTHQDYVAKVKTLKPGQRVKVTLMRDGRSRDVTLTVGERPRLPSDLGD